MSNIASESEIQMRNVMKRAVPVINDHEQKINDLMARLVVVERKITEVDLENQRLRGILGGMMAQQFGTGATSTKGD